MIAARQIFQTTARALCVSLLALVGLPGVGANGLDLPNGAPAAQTHAKLIHQGESESSNWSGYIASSGTFTQIRGSWIVPTLTGYQPFAAGASWIGIGGVNSSDLIQTGTEEQVIGTGQVVYDAWIELLPEPSQTIPLTVNPGDHISGTITEQSPSTWQLSLANTTTGQTFQQSLGYNSSLSSAEWIVERPSTGRRLLPLDNFGTIQFSGCQTIRNDSLNTIAQAGGVPVTMVAFDGTPLATPSALGPDGASFTVTRGTAVPVFPILPIPGFAPIPAAVANQPQPRGSGGLDFPLVPFGSERGAPANSRPR